MFLCSCGSNDELIEQKPDDTVYVTFKVEGLNQQLHDNVQAFLNTMPAIVKERVFLFNREIRENTQKALRAFGYYHPEIKVELPKRDDPNATEVVVSVDAGKPLFIRNCNVEILGEGADYKVFSDLLSNSSIKSYTLLDHGAYEKLKSDLRSKALSLGFFDVELLSSRIMVYTEENFADIELLIDTGKRYSFGKFITDETTDELLKTSPCRFYGDFPSEGNITENLNLCIAGHNYDNDKFFSKIKDLNINDKIYIYDNFDNQYMYSVIKNYEVKSDDLSPVYETITDSFELTLVTCNNFNCNRISIKAKIEDD